MTQKMSSWLIYVFEFACNQKCSGTKTMDEWVPDLLMKYDIVYDVYANMQRLLLQTFDRVVYFGYPINEVRSINI